MATKFESLSGELIMSVIEFVDNPLSIFLNLNSDINRILFDRRIKLSAKTEDHHEIMSLQTNLTRLVSRNFKGENLGRFQNLKSLTLFIDENILDKVELPLSLIFLKIHFNADVSPSLFHSLPTLKRLQTLIITSKNQSQVTFPLDTIVFNRNIKILKLINIPVAVSLLYHCEELTQLQYLEVQLIEASDPFDYMSFKFSSSLKTILIQFELSFTHLEYVLDGCIGDNLKHLELYSHTNTAQPDYLDAKRWCQLFQRFQNLTKCQIQLRQKGRRTYMNLCRQFRQELKRVEVLDTKWNMQCYSSCPGYHGCVVYVQISANL